MELTQLSKDKIESLTWFLSIPEETQHEYITKYFKGIPIYTPDMVNQLYEIIIKQDAISWFKSLSPDDFLSHCENVDGFATITTSKMISIYRTTLKEKQAS